MTRSVQHAFDAEINNLRTLIAIQYERADDQGATALEFASKMVDKAESALGCSDSARTWLQLTGAIDFMSASGIAPDDLAEIRAKVDSLLDAA